MHLRHGFNSCGFACLFLGLLLPSIPGRKLKYVIVIYRHGDRSPISTFPTNEVPEDAWPQGYLQLTKSGIWHQYLLGRSIKDRYTGFLSSDYKRKEIYIRSTDTDRTIMSAQANLAGLFPPRGSQIWNPEIRWQPIPVHTVPRSEEKLLYFPVRAACPLYDKLLKETFQSKIVQKKVKSQMPLLSQLASKLGYTIQTLLDVHSNALWNAYDALLVQRKHKKPVPSWATDKVMEQWKRLMIFSLHAMFGIHKRKLKSRLQGGLLVKDILDKMRKATTATDGRKMLMYSAHDMTIVALQIALGVFDDQLPPFGATMFFELYKEDDGGYTVEMYYRAQGVAPPRVLALPECTEACPLETFTEKLSDVIPDDWEAECNS